jgi:hypothetical protein
MARPIAAFISSIKETLEAAPRVSLKEAAKVQARQLGSPVWLWRHTNK